MKIIPLIKNEPLATFALLGIALGAMSYFFISQEVADLFWRSVLIFGGSVIVFHTVKGIIHGKFAADIVAMLAILVAILLEQVFAGSIVVLMQSGGEAIERYGFRKASFSLEELLKRAPRKARKKSNFSDEYLEVQLDEVQVGDLILIKPGDMVPVDAFVLEGVSTIDDSAITGEPFEKQAFAGSKLLSGSINISGVLQAKAIHLAKDSQYNKIVELVKKAQEEKAPIQRLADKAAIFFTPLTLFMALLGYLITHDFTTILSVLVVATPCPLILATPLAVICAINQSAKEGIIVKGGTSMEEVARTDAIFFDKTGTITRGLPEIEKIVPLEHLSKNEILQLAASLEQFSSHCLATAIVESAKNENLKISKPQEFTEIPGKGLKGQVDGAEIFVGSYDLMQALFNIAPKIMNDPRLKDLNELNALLVFVGKNKQIVGVIVLKDQIRKSAKTSINALKSIGIHNITMLTGDRQVSAEIIAKQVNIYSVEGNLEPSDKLQAIQLARKKNHHILMVGDGINDAPALASANVGIAMGAKGSAISVEAASIVLLIDDLMKVPNVIQIGKRMLKIAKQSIAIGIGLSFILMIFAAFGYVIPAVGALLQEIIDIAVILNALRVLTPNKD